MTQNQKRKIKIGGSSGNKMKDYEVKTELFNKLNQLDRIEYMLGMKTIDDKYGWSLVYYIMFLFISTFNLLLLFLISGIFSQNVSFTTQCIEMIYPLIISFIIFIMIGIIHDIIILIICVKAKVKFNGKFFKIEVKKK